MAGFQHHPIRNLTAQLRKHNVFSKKNFQKITAFYVKLLFEKPFRIFESLSCGKKINHHKLDQDPIFIIGHWRSGTSFLQYLMAQDPQFGFMNKFQVVFPDIFLQSEKFLKPLINKIPDTLNLIRDAQNMSINLELDSPSEIEIALTTMISPTSLHWGHIFPQNAWEYFDKYLFFETANRSEIEQWKRDYAFLIKKISLNADGRQVLIKSPGNASRIEKLLELYPKAKFIFIHRNPYDVFYSSKKLWNTLLDNLALQEFSAEEIEQEIVRVYAKLMSAYIQQRSQIPNNQLAEIRFEDFIADPLTEMKSAYDKLAIPGYNQAQPHFKQFLKQKTSGKSSDYTYEPRVLDMLNKNWEFAFKEWKYSIIYNKVNVAGKT